MTDSEIAAVLAEKDDEFKGLSAEHRELEKKITEMDARRYLSAEEEVERKRLQKLKLKHKDRMAELIREYRKKRTS